jgi:hypothetical protein
MGGSRIVLLSQTRGSRGVSVYCRWGSKEGYEILGGSSKTKASARIKGSVDGQLVVMKEVSGVPGAAPLMVQPLQMVPWEASLYRSELEEEISKEVEMGSEGWCGESTEHLQGSDKEDA